MENATNQELLGILIQHEDALAGMYGTFGSALPGMKVFFTRLVQEEKAHADVLRALSGQLESGGILLNRRKFNAVAVKSSIEYIQRQVVKISGEGITPIKALALAIDCENAIIEKGLFGVFETDSVAMKHEFQALCDHTIAHKKILENTLAAEKKKGA